MSGRPRTTSFAEGNKQPLNPPLGGMKISSKCTFVRLLTSDDVRRSGCSVGYGVSSCLPALRSLATWRRSGPGLGPWSPTAVGPGKGAAPQCSSCRRQYKQLSTRLLCFVHKVNSLMPMLH